MALLRSDILNRDLIEAVLKRIESTKRIAVLTLTIGSEFQSGAALLEDVMNVWVTAKVNGREKEYFWIAKMLKPETKAADSARLEGHLEREINFYQNLVPELSRLKSPLPLVHRLLHSNYSTLNREILLLEDLRQSQFETPKATNQGLDLDHVLLVVDWLAKLHGLSHVLSRKHPGGPYGWMQENPWVKILGIQGLKEALTVDYRDGLMALATSLLNSDGYESKGIRKLLEMPNWLEWLREEMQNTAPVFEKPRCLEFRTLCHGQPWFRNTLFSYKKDESSSSKRPSEVALGDLHSCHYGRPGSDLAHFMVTSTSRLFRVKNLESILEVYHKKLEEVCKSNGFYSMNALKTDYRAGLVPAISFCILSMSTLANHTEKEVTDLLITELMDLVSESTQLNGNLMLERLLDGLMDVCAAIEI